MKKILKWGGIALVVLIVIGVLSGKGSDSQKVGSNDTTSNTQDQKQEEQIYKVGDKIQMGDVILTVNKVETSLSGQYTKPSEGNKWVDLNLTIENTGKDQEYITTLGQMFIIDSNNNQYQVAVTGKRLQNSGSMGLDGAIVAGAKKTEWVGFEVPKTSTGLKLQYNASFFSNKKILVDLGI